MLVSVLIIALSLVLFIYWFRYCCVLLLRNSQTELAVAPVSQDTRFGVSDVLERLQTDEKLDPIHQALNRDYQVFTYLVQHAAGLELSSLEDRLLLLDYRLMRMWYRVAVLAAPRQARSTLAEMASILRVLIFKMGQQAGLHAEA